ncbi:MAG: YdeI/OmpD-associated family protein [Anaerolineaceae bacterium]|nr:YdeI/OmpD-associated family protein [Anaerolineaceae bacterium]
MMKKELKNPGPIEFLAPIIDAGVGAYIEFPFDTLELFDTVGRIPVVVEFDGVPYQGTMLRYGTEKHIIILVKKIREAIGKQAPEVVHVKVELDNRQREVSIPEDVQLALKENPPTNEKFQKLAFTHQKEYMRWIEDAKRPETRQRRVEKMIQELLGSN